MRTSISERSTRPTKWAVFCILGILLLQACRKPEPDLGLELLPGDPLGLSGTAVPLHAFTIEGPEIRTSGLTRNLVGSYLDPQFGLVKAGIVAQLRLSSNNVGSGMDTSGLQADSLVLSLAFDPSAYGYGGLAAQRFKVYELSEDLSVDTVYQNTDVPEVLPQDLVAQHYGVILPRPGEYVHVNGDSLPPQLRIRLDHALAERFLNAFNTPSLADNNAFLQFFKGLYITVDNGQQLPFQEGLLYFDLLNAASKATLYYHDVNDPVPQAFDLPINENSVRYTVSEFDRAQAQDPGLAQALMDTVNTPDALYLQALGGTRVAMRMPSILEQPFEDRALANAVLVVPVKGTYNPYLTPPTQIFLFRRDSAGGDAFLPDQLGGLGNVDGLFRPDEQAYHFNVTRYVQQVLTGGMPNSGFEMVVGGSGVTASRVVLEGPGTGAEGTRLLLTFTTY